MQTILTRGFLISDYFGLPKVMGRLKSLFSATRLNSDRNYKFKGWYKSVEAGKHV
jgi:hypothetical protein